MDKIRALRYFKQVAEVNSFSRAAQMFDVPASSISRRIKDLENELGVELIKRTTRHVSTTELGSVYVELIADALKKIDDADELISQRMDAMEGKLTISVTASYGEKVLSPILQKFRMKYPAITLDIEFSDDKVILGKDSVDIAIRAGHAPQERVVAKKLSSDPFVLVATPQLFNSLSTRFGHSVLTVDDVENSPTLLYRGPQGVRDWWTSQKDGWQKANLSPVMRSNSGSALLEAALAHEGLALYPQWWVKEYIESGELIAVPTAELISSAPSLNLDIFILYQQAKYQIPKIKCCVDFILEHTQC